jgi:hypothetical protein
MGLIKNEEHFNKFFLLTKENPASTKKKKKKLDQKNDNKNIIKYKTEIEDITKHACYCCKTLCFAFKIHVVSKLF